MCIRDRAYPFIRDMAARMMEMVPGLMIHVYEIRNDFFGEMITVSGLLTGQDLIAQLTGRELGLSLIHILTACRSFLWMSDIRQSDFPIPAGGAR